MQRFIGSIALAAIALGFTAPAAQSADAPPESPATFLSSATQSGMLFAESAKLALDSSRNPAVHELAQRLAYDYRRINDDLGRIARSNVVPAPDGMDQGHASMLASLRASNPAGFDAAYVAQMAAESTKLVQLFQANLLNPNAEILYFSSYNLPVVREHARLANELKSVLLKR
jgi:putative membrane protein